MVPADEGGFLFSACNRVNCRKYGNAVKIGGLMIEKAIALAAAVAVAEVAAVEVAERGAAAVIGEVMRRCAPRFARVMFGGR